MPFQLADRVHETTTSTGIGSIALGGAANASKLTFLAGIGAGNVTCYCITDGNAFEVGVGQVIAGSPPTLSRDRVLASSSNNNRINWTAGTKTVFGVAPAQFFMMLANNGAGTSRPWYALPGTIWSRSSDWQAYLFDGQQDRRLLQAGDVESALPGRLGVRAFDITDWNNALENGWYMASGATNAPPGETGSGAWWMGFVERHNELYVTQTVHAFSGNSGPNNTMVWRRRRFNGTWSDWYKLQWSQQEQDARYALNSHLAQFGIATNTVTTRNTSPNTLTNGGFYYVSPNADLPVANYWGYLHTEVSDVTSHRKQTFTTRITNRTFFRQMSSNVWSPWTEYITTDNIGNYAPPGLGVGQTWQDVSAQRQVQTVYQNTTGKPIMVLFGATGSGTQRMSVSHNNSTWIEMALAQNNDNGRYIYIIVPPGHYYRADNAGGFGRWLELR
ncbi:pyocin knob domain-containing protein [Telmatospirillum sp. J64-1]|uniref:pyocin knob domain-containing protein n=1 Tax=Telmatospirillum sp. J64-1 TaxID=2502183 RepID=UPI00115CAFC5|nr:pyocin knob domain-containing protein [Telmatospirillum sp. J64-1]